MIMSSEQSEYCWLSVDMLCSFLLTEMILYLAYRLLFFVSGCLLFTNM